MKKQKVFFGNLATVAALALGFGLAGNALACTEPGQCFDTLQKINVGGSTTFQGFGAGMFNGSEGGIRVDKVGHGSTELVLNVAGNTCDIDCRNGNFTFNAKAGEMVRVQGYALGTTAGDTVSVINEGGAFSGATFQFGKLNISPPAQ